MKYTFGVVMVAGLVLAVLVGCATDSSSPVGSITINSVTPNSGLTEALRSFVVEVSYELMDTSQGELAIGFNTGSSVTSYIIITGAKQVVGQGSGTHTFNVSVTPKNWGGFGDFQAYANISEYPHDMPYSPLDSDRMVLTF